MSEKNRIRFGIFHKVLLTMVLVSVVPLTATWYVNYLNSTDSIGRSIEFQFKQGLGHLTHHVNSWVDMNRRMLNQNARLPDILSMNQKRQEPTLKLIASEYDWNYLVFTVAPDGQNIARSDGKKTRFYGDRVYVKQVIEGEPLGKQVLIGKTSGKPALVMAVPIRQQEKLKGVLAIAMTIAELSERVTTTRIGETGFAFLVDESGKIIAHPSAEMTGSRQDLSANPAVAAGLAGEETGRLVYADQQGRKIISHMQRTADGWLMVMQQDYKEAYAALEENNRHAVILLAITVLLVIIIALLFSRRISGPILQLTKAAEEVSRGKVDTTIEGTDRGDEIGLLATAINRLRNSTRLAMERLTHAKKRTR